ncbi:MAG TPA: Eco57I restriction-modification methylase domain-containing protein, partial [Blastocatellia bacterium]|nr:Eco57I restriction-modification methylase domain-containing protein [Blastocatellia bacterium]
ACGAHPLRIKSAYLSIPSVLEVLTKPRLFTRLIAEPLFRDSLQITQRADLSPFHWELDFAEAFFDENGRRTNPGFDAIIGNPPYDVLSEAETGRDLSTLRAFIDYEPIYEPSLRGKNNLYKLFICRSLHLLAEGGHMGLITPMAVLGDDQAADIRKQILDIGYFTGIEAFPQKDNPNRRVFPEAKLSTAVFLLVKSKANDADSRRFISRVHPGREIEPGSPSLELSTSEIPLYDPVNFTVVSCSQTDWDLATRIMDTGRLVRLRQYTKFFQGEVNETNERTRGNLLDGPEGKLVTRGASICLYMLRPASQGDDLWLNVEKFLRGKDEETKAFHHRYDRIGLQESCPQNNFRRVIAAFIPAGEYCNHKVNYLPEHTSQHPLKFVLGLLNSKLTDWYFRLGSTNAAVSHYQLYNLPCPVFAVGIESSDQGLQKMALRELRNGDINSVFEVLQPALINPPFSQAIRAVIIEAVNRIISIEENRGDIPRAARSALDPKAQPYQDLIDQLFYAMAGLTEEESSQLEMRLAQML